MLEFLSQISNFFVINGYTFEIIIAFSLFGSLFKKRNNGLLFFIIGYCFLLAFSITWNYLNIESSLLNNTLKYIVMLTLSSLCVFMYRKMSFLGLLYCIAGGATTQHLAFNAYSFFICIINSTYGTLISGIFTFVVEAIVYALVYQLLIKKNKNQNKEYFEDKHIVIVVLAIVLFTLFFHFVLDEVINISDNKIEYLVYDGFAILCCLFTYYLMSGIFKTNKLYNDIAVLDHLVHMQEDQYMANKKSMEMINIKCHDIKQQLSKYGNKMSAEDIQEMRDLINIYDSNLQTGNEVLDVFLAEKSLICERNGIVFDCIADGKALEFMKISDIYSLFGNLIDNAIEAVNKLGNRDLKTISLKIIEKINFLLIHIENYYDGNVKFENGFPVTSKDDTNYHGFGMQSIKMIVHRYNGYIAFETDNNVFGVNITIPLGD